MIAEMPTWSKAPVRVPTRFNGAAIK